MITVDLDGVKDSLVGIVNRNNDRAGKPVDAVSGTFQIIGDVLAALVNACELGMSIAVDVREIRKLLEERVDTLRQHGV